MPTAAPSENPPPPQPRRNPTNLLIVVTLAALIVLAMIAVARRGPQPPPPQEKNGVPAAAARAAMEEAAAKLHDSNWVDFEGVTKADLERRLLLLDAAIFATDAYSSAVERLDPAIPENRAAQINRENFVYRAQFYRTGRRTVEFLRDHFGQWKFIPVERRVEIEDPTLYEQFTAIFRELQGAAAQAKAASQAATGPATGPATEPSGTRPAAGA